MLQTLRHRSATVILEAKVRPFFLKQFQDVKIVVVGLLLVDPGLDRGHMGRGVAVLVRLVQIHPGFDQIFKIANIPAAYGLKKQGEAVDVWGV